jgi:hypothetical protein
MVDSLLKDFNNPGSCPHKYAILLNGSAAPVDNPEGWRVDRSLELVRIDPSFLRQSPNELTLKCRYDETHPGLEIIYLLGAFGVTIVGGRSVQLTHQPKTLSPGDWTTQGLPFYSGMVSYHGELSLKIAAGRRCFLRLPSYKGVAARVLIDGEEAGIIAWPPPEIDITNFVPRRPLKRFRLTIEIMGSRRNSHGPLHLAQREPQWTGPGQFGGEYAPWSDGYVLAPMGLMAPPEILFKEKA